MSENECKAVVYVDDPGKIYERNRGSGGWARMTLAEKVGVRAEETDYQSVITPFASFR